MSNFDRRVLVQKFEAFQESKNEIYDKYCQALWKEMNSEATIGKREIVYLMGPVGRNHDELFEYVRSKFTSDGGYECSRTISHAFQCDCTCEMGCQEWVKIVFI